MDVASSERLRAHLRPRSFERRLRLQGFRFLVTTSPVRVHPITRGFQPSLRSVLRRSQPLDGFLRAPAPRLVSSSNRVQEQLRRSGASLSTRASSLVERRCPLAVGEPDPPAALRLRGQNRSASTSRLCSAWRSVHSAPVISRNGGRSPPRVRVSSRHSTPRHALRFTRDASARDVPAVGLRLRDLRRPAPPAYCPPRSRAVLSPDPPTCSRF